MPFTYECAGCGKQGTKPTQIKTRAFCTRECYQRSIIKYPDRECPQCGVTFSPRLGSRAGPRTGRVNRTYCTRECYEASRANPVTKTCPVCGRDYTISKGATAGRYTVCSRACRTADTIYVDCERCGQFFRAEKHLNRRYCSEGCRRPPVYVTCRNCGETNRVGPAYAEAGRQFCSVSCYRRFVGETALESRVRLALEGLGAEFEQEHGAGKWSIDFALVGQRIAIEADGDYWHSITAERDTRRDAALERAGWRVVRLAECEVNDAPDPGQLIRDRVYEVTGVELAQSAARRAARNESSSLTVSTEHRHIEWG